MSCIQCELTNLLLEAMQPDQDLVDLIEQAFSEGQIDSQKADLAYWWLRGKQRQSGANCYPQRYPKHKGLNHE